MGFWQVYLGVYGGSPVGPLQVYELPSSFRLTLLVGAYFARSADAGGSFVRVLEA